MPYRYHYDPNEPRVPAGQHDGGQWTRDRYGQHAIVQPAFYDPRRFAIQKLIEAALALFTWLSLRNSSKERAVIAFKAREYQRNEAGDLNLEDVRLLNRDQVRDACPRLEEVQNRTDAAVAAVRPYSRYLTPTDYGTAVHVQLKKQIDALKDPDFRAEVSYLKGVEEDYGTKGSIRVDVLENVRNETVCVYDIKTGQRGLSFPRMTEIAARVLAAYPGTQRIIVTEIRPTP